MNTHAIHNTEIVITEVNELERLQDLRSRVLAGEEIPPDEYRIVIDSLRRSRTALPTIKSTVTRAKKGEAIIDPNKVLKRDEKTAKMDDLLGDDE